MILGWFLVKRKRHAHWRRYQRGDGDGGDSEVTFGLAASNATCILLSQKSIFDNIALALYPDPSTVSFHRVVEVGICTRFWLICERGMIPFLVLGMIKKGDEGEYGWVEDRVGIGARSCKIRNPPTWSLVSSFHFIYLFTFLTVLSRWSDVRTRPTHSVPNPFCSA